MTTAPLLEASEDYADRWAPDGAGVLPLRGKVPTDPATGLRMAGWQRLATADPATLSRWFGCGSAHVTGVGVAPRGAFAALDVDRRRGDDETLFALEQRLGQLPATPTYQTSDGWRPLLASPGVPLRSEIDGIKIICATGQIAMPPSRHASGFVYGWEADFAPGDLGLAPIPQAWLAALRALERHLSPVPDPGDDFLAARPPTEYVHLLTGLSVEPGGKARCPLPGHRDRTPSFHVYAEAERGWFCFGCGRGGGIYQLAALLAGLEPPLRGRDFLAVEATLRDLYAERLGVAM